MGAIMDDQELYTISEAVIRFRGLKAEKFLRVVGFDSESHYFFQQNTIAAALENQLIEDTQRVPSEYAYYLGGAKVNNPLNAYPVRDVKFPKEAFYNWWKEDHHGLKAPEWFSDLIRADASKEVLEVEQTTVEDDIKIIEGLTLKELREYLTEGSDEYLPRLLAVLRAKKRIIAERDNKDADGFKKFGTAKNALKKLAEILVVEEFKVVGVEKVSDTDKKALSRILLKELAPPTGQGGTY